MIKANELRIGNWVQVFGVYKSSVDKAGLVQADAELLYLIGSGKILCIGVLLIPEILEKCGFVKSAEFNIWYSMNGRLALEYFNDGVWWTIDDIGYNEGSTPRDIQHLHQLQNLFFALTGTELNVNL